MKSIERRVKALESQVPSAPVPVPGIEVQFVAPDGRVTGTLHLDPEDKQKEITK